MIKTDPIRIEERLRELELELLQLEVRQNPERLSSLLADGFREFGSSGRILNRNEVINALQVEPLTECSISDFRVDLVAGGIALVTYRAVRRGEDPSEAASLRSSLWVLRDDRWQMLFHQGTPARDFR